MNEKSDAALLAGLRALWEEIDPVPAGLADQVIAALAIEDFDRQWELLSLVPDAEFSTVRGDSDLLTLQFSDGSTSVLLHVSGLAGGFRRVDGWVDGQVASAELLQGARAWQTTPDEAGRFAFTDIPPGLSRLCLLIQQPDGSQREYRTPQFEA